jgi:hypothetical protein
MLTDEQIICLSCADFDRPIFPQMKAPLVPIPPEAHTFNWLVILDLLKRGHLVESSGGYLLTERGAMALREAMGF